MSKVLGKDIEEWMKEYPLLKEVIGLKELLWLNPAYSSCSEAMPELPLGERDIRDAEDRLERFAPYIRRVFPETESTKGIIESPLVKIPDMQRGLEKCYGFHMEGQLFLKCDSHLPISGSIKARGGIYEVLKHAEDLALKEGMLRLDDDYSIIDSQRFRDFYSRYSIAVGSTGNLGLSIGIMSAKLGFKVTVHMSADAKKWKKELLRSKGVNVVEYASDYSLAVAEGRKQSQQDQSCYFVDDENSANLFLGYAVAAQRLKSQLQKDNIAVDENHPLFVYLPCGVGGGPGGVAFGLKILFGDNVHCFFGEPTHSPCMLIGCMTGQHEKLCVQDFGIDNITAADGLAVGRPSGFVGHTLRKLLSGVYTATDERLYQLLTLMADSQGIFLEPSALAGVAGMAWLFNEGSGRSYIEKHGLQSKMKNSLHIAWATGGSMVPKEEMDKYYSIGRSVRI